MSPLNRLQRRDEILQALAITGEVTFVQLAKELDVSEMTIRRDIEQLERTGELRRVRGGAISAVSRSHETPVPQREETSSAAKEAIARVAASLVEDGDTVILDGGTTSLALARELRVKRDLTVVTPSLSIAIELATVSDIRIIVTGGQVHRTELSLTGAAAEEAFASVNCDLAFIGVAGVRVSPGLTDFNLDDARVKLAAIRSARRRIVLADSTKIGRVTFATIAPLTDVDVLVTDAPGDDPTLVAAASIGLQVLSATVGGELRAIDERWPGRLAEGS
jgi:DeoR/GlpR family transcriptional regulator of sugar metabolism